MVCRSSHRRVLRIRIQDHKTSDRILHIHIHRSSRDQQQPWAQPRPHAFRSSHRSSHRVCIRRTSDHIRIHHSSRGQRQPWAQPQPHAFHSSHRRVLRIRIQDHKTSDRILHIRIHHSSRGQRQPWAQPRHHAFHSSHRSSHRVCIRRTSLRILRIPV